jgi:hypothetical protein
MFGAKKKKQPPAPPPPPPKITIVDADDIMNGKGSLDEELAEPYVMVQSKRVLMRNLIAVINSLAKEKGYKVTVFSVTDIFSYVILEKK